MRILQVIQKQQLRGAEIFACQLSNHLLELGHDVAVISLFGGSGTLPYVREIHSLNRPASNRLFDIIGLKSLAKEIERFQPCVVQTNAGDTVKFTVLSKILFNWKAPIVLRNANMVSDFVTTKSKRFFNRWLVKNVDFVVSVSERCKNDFIQTYSYPASQIRSIPIGVECKPFHTSMPNDLRIHFEGHKVLINVASLVPEKNHFGLLSIIRKLIDIFPEIRLLIVGDGRLRDDIQERISSMGLQQHVFLIGYRNDVFSLLSNSHALLLPSKIEGLPGVILEAQLCRCPVIAYNVGGIAEVIENRKTGWLIEPFNELEFVQSIIESFDAGKTKLVQETAYRQVLDFDNKHIAKRFAGVFEALGDEG